MARAPRVRDRQRGQSLVELALVLPVMLVFLAGALDLGRVFYATITLNNAAREGAIQASKTPGSYLEDQPCDTTTNLVVCRVQLEARGSMVRVAPTDIDLACSVGCVRSMGSTVTVNVHGQFDLLTPLLSAVFGGQRLELNAQATAPIIYLPDPDAEAPPGAPVAQFTSDYAGPAVGPFTVRFTDLSTNVPTGWMWDLDGNGTIDSHDQNPTWEYTVPGTYTVTLTAINPTNADIETKVSYIEVLDPAPTDPEPTATTPSCEYIPNVMGKDPSIAFQTIFNAGFKPVGLGDLVSGQKNKVQAQSPDHTECEVPNSGFEVTYHYRPG